MCLYHRCIPTVEVATMMKEIYYFTFGCGQPHEGWCQPILAEDGQVARAKMVELYGNKWSFQYNEPPTEKQMMLMEA